MTKSLILIYITSFCHILHPVHTGIIHTSKACYGSGTRCVQHDINCSGTQKIAIYDAYYTDNTECGPTGVSSCGTVNPENVTERGYHRFNINEVVSLYKNCSRKHGCRYRANRRGAADTFSVFKYQCIGINVSKKISDDAAGGSSEVLLSLGDTVVSNCTSKNNAVTCTFTFDENTSCISIYALDVRLRGKCLSQLSVLTENHITTNNCSTSFEPFERLNVTTDLPLYIHIDLPQPSLIWLLINGTGSGSTVNRMSSTKDITSQGTTPTSKKHYIASNIRTDTSTHKTAAGSSRITRPTMTLTVLSTVTMDSSTNAAGQTGSNTGAIAGGVVATVVAVLVVTLVSVLVIQRRRQESEVKEKTASIPKDANPDTTYSLADNLPQNNYHEIQTLRTENGEYDYATADGMVLPPTTNTYFIIEPAGKHTAGDNSKTAEGDYDHLGDKPSPQTSDYDTTASVVQPGYIGEDGYGYNHFQKKVNPQTHQNDYDTAASATKAVAQISTTKRNTDEDNYDHFQRGTNASETVSSPYDTTSGINDNPDYSVAGQMK